MPLAYVNSANLYYETHGSGQPLLFISGLGGHAGEIAHLAESYGAHLQFVTYDNRGCGRSDDPATEISIASLADDAAALLDLLEIDDAVVYGSSMGGMVAQELVLRHPRRVAALMLGCTTAGAIRGVRPTSETIQTMVRNQSLTGDEALEAGWALGYSPDWITANHDALLARSRRAARYAAPQASYMRQVIAAAQHDTYDRLGQITCPVMIIHGSNDLMMPVGNAELLKKGIAHAEMHILDGMGHGYNLEAQAIADALVLDFVRRNAPAAAKGVSRAAR